MPDSESTARTHCNVCSGELLPGPHGAQCPRCALAMAATPELDDEARVAELFPELELDEKIARGGFGAVFRAEHRRLKRQVALKFLDPVLARSPEAVARFEREMVAVGRLDHPGIVRAHDAGERDGQWFLVMEFVDGADCGALVRKHGALPIREACEIVRQAAVALQYAHERGLIHRDVKPGNIMLSRTGNGHTQVALSAVATPSKKPGTKAGGEPPSTVKVLDFGLADLMHAGGDSGQSLTQSNAFLGTLDYAAPEQIETPGKVDVRADVYGLGATLRRLLTGQSPHSGTSGSSEESLFLRMKRITSEPVAPIASLRADVPPALAKVCDQMLALDRTKRPETAAAVAAALAPFCEGAHLERLFEDGPLPGVALRPPGRKRHVWWWLTGAAGAFLLSIFTWFLTHRSTATALLPAELGQSLHLTPETIPMLVSQAWQVEEVIPFPREIRSARFTPDGGIFYVEATQEGSDPLRHRPARGEAGQTFATPEEDNDVWIGGIAPDTGYAIWTQHRDSKNRAFGRAKTDGTLLPSIGFADGKRSGPMGFAFAREGHLPAGTTLRAGDVLIAETCAFGKKGHGGLWRCRFDNDEPAELIGQDEKQLNAPVDVAIGRGGVFLLNRRSSFYTEEAAAPTDFNRRLYRWSNGTFFPCTSSLPLRDPAGLAVDPLSNDLFVLEGSNFSLGHRDQRLLRLHPTGPDTYEVEVIAHHLGIVSECGLGISNDGQRLVVTDSGYRLIVVLRRGEKDKRD